MSAGQGSLRRRRRWRAWVHYSDDELLDLRLCDLDLRIRGTVLARRVRQLHAELEARGLRFRPHVWLSSEWFAPDGIPGIGVPYYLAHPRLMKLEAQKMFRVEGGTRAACMRILRHEAGHAVDTAYRLHFRKRWRETFGRYSAPYPHYYSPKPDSRSFVLNLEAWYAQAHPAEDFAETFAVWLAPRSNWRQLYRQWPAALRKLEYVDELMREIAGRPPMVRSTTRVEPVDRLTLTLREHYQEKRRRYRTRVPDFLDRDLRRLFSGHPEFARRPAAAALLRRLRPAIRDTVAEWTGHHPYAVDQVVQELIEICRRLKLRLVRPAREARTHAILLVTLQALRSGRYEIAL